MGWKEQEEQARNNEQRELAEALRDTANALNQTLNLREVLDRILNNIGRVVPNDAANIMLIENGIARMAACRGYEKIGGEERVMSQLRPVSEVPNLHRMAQSGQPIVIPDTEKSSEWISFNTSDWIRSYASAPICRMGNTVGYLNLNSATPGFFTQEHANRLLAFADQAAVAIENARLYESAQSEIAVRKKAEEELQEAKNELEVRVEQRTAELRKANEQLRIELTRRIQAEKALEEERALLAKRIEERTGELSSANAELAKAVRLKDSFLASMSHELRTPLNAILNISETLQEQVYGPLNEQQQKSIQTVEESGRHLLSLINDILDLSKIGAGKFDILWDFVPVEPVCQASMKLIEEAARKKNLTVSASYDTDVKTVWADQRRIKQILVNLLSNAVKFTPAGGSVGLTVRGDHKKKQVQFIVWDTGIGISEGSIKYLFKPFVQLDNSLARQYEGTGLGLALVYSIVDLHGGGIRAESELGKGSRFIVTLNWEGDVKNPIETRPGSSISQQAVETTSEETLSLSDPMVRVRRYLNELSIETTNHWTDDGFHFEVDLIDADILVINTQGQSPIDAGNRWLTLTDEYETPIIAITNHKEQVGDLSLSDRLGFLPFPFDRQELRSLIRRVTANGTSSLVHSAAILNIRTDCCSDDQPLILIADDNEVSVKILNDYLQRKGYRVMIAHNGAEAIEKARAAAPDLIIMDVQMPGMDGLEATRRIRMDSRVGNTPIITLTALAMPGDRASCLQAGANEYLSKPISLMDLTNTVQSLLKNAA